jgi:hypothetical protein
MLRAMPTTLHTSLLRGVPRMNAYAHQCQTIPRGYFRPSGRAPAPHGVHGA